jgi:hypothetical protein
MSFNSDKFIQAKIMQLIEPTYPKNFKFTVEFENAVENELSKTNDINDAFTNVSSIYAQKSGVSLTDMEIRYAMDLYLGINPWTKNTKA